MIYLHLYLFANTHDSAELVHACATKCLVPLVWINVCQWVDMVPHQVVAVAGNSRYILGYVQVEHDISVAKDMQKKTTRNG